MTIPDLSGLITKDDVNHINMGNRQIDYTSWAKITQLIKQNAPGWEFNLRQSESSNFVWSAPNGTGFFVCYFTSPEKEATADFPYPIMDHRNNPVKFSEISSRVLTDNHRRAFCACACFTFALAHEMWSQEEVRDTALKNTVTDTQPQPQGDPVRDPSKPVVHPSFGARLTEKEKEDFIDMIRTFNKNYPSKSDWLIATFHEETFPGTQPKREKYWSTNLLFKNNADLVAKLIDEATQELKAMPF
jgi:hypothetical protein